MLRGHDLDPLESTGPRLRAAACPAARIRWFRSRRSGSAGDRRCPPEHAGKIIAALGRERTELDKDDTKKTFRILGHHFQKADCGSGIAREANRFGSERFTIPRVVSQRGEKSDNASGEVIRLMSFAVRFRSV